MTEFIYPAIFAEADEGGFVVTFPDFPEAITQGDTFDEAYEQASDCLEEALASYILNNKNIPNPKRVTKGYHAIPCGAQIASKAALYITMKSTGINKSQLAERLGCNEKEVRRMLDPKHATKIYRIENALHLLGKRVYLSLDDEESFYEVA